MDVGCWNWQGLLADTSTMIPQDICQNIPLNYYGQTSMVVVA